MVVVLPGWGRVSADLMVVMVVVGYILVVVMMALVRSGVSSS